MSSDDKKISGNGTPDRSPEWRRARRNVMAGAGAFAAALLVAGKSASAHGRRRGGHGGHHCFLAGTPILTPSGEVDVASLQPGDLVITKSDVAKRIVGIGRRTVTVEAGRSIDREDRPVCIKRGAIDDMTPSADLYVSRNHALLIDDMLVSAASLVNGRTIINADMSDRASFEYVHIELAAHDVVMAAGTAAETLRVESQSREGFDTFDTEDTQAPVATLVSIAPLVGHNRHRDVLRSRLRSALSPIVDRRTPLDKLRDRLEDRAA